MTLTLTLKENNLFNMMVKKTSKSYQVCGHKIKSCRVFYKNRHILTPL